MVYEKPFLPKIIYLNPRHYGTLTDMEPCLERCAMMGFDHVLMPALDAWSDAPAADNPALHKALSGVAGSCRRNGLKLLLDINISSVAAASDLPKRNPHWFERHNPQDDLPDPRYPVQVVTASTFHYQDPAACQEIQAYWQQTLASWTGLGVAGFRCMDVASPPAAIWSQLIAFARAREPGLRFLAWTPGCTPAQISSLTGCGFDASFSSGAWWDFRSHWLVEEQARLNRLAPPIAFPDSPDQPVIARVAGVEDIRLRRQIYLRALHLAAATGNGILIPMEFIFALEDQAGQASELWREPDALHAGASIDLSADMARANALVADLGSRFYAGRLHLLSGPDASAAVLLRMVADLADPSGDALLIIVSADLMQTCTVSVRQMQERAMGFVRYRRIWPDAGTELAPMQPVELAPLTLQLFAAHRNAPILLPDSRGDQAVMSAATAPRIAIEAVTPSVDGGKFPVKRIIGESVNIEADVFTDGHDKIAVALLWRPADESAWQEVRMHATGNDRWSASLPLTRIGRYIFAIEAWRDVFATYRDELEKKTTAGLNVGLELEEGRLLVEAAAQYAKDRQSDSVAATLSALADKLKAAPARADDINPGANDAERIAALLSEPVAEAMRAADARPFVIRSDPLLIDVERPAARFSSWYELFPRSQSGDPARHGTFDDVIQRLPAIQAMGFDTLYFTPIHPIGKKHRKGRNNSLTPGPDDPGSPYAIGSEEGGHDAIHPQLGTLDDFRRLRVEAARHGLELALDFAIQCSPDHPWLKQHPDWFDWRPDGSIRYAENPPKKYQDIVNVDFYAKGAVPGLWVALRDVVLFWVKEGVRVFRVDNPHTKPLPFWEWLIADIRGRYPDTLFLSEAFTRPKMMYRLAKVGYSQSYTYFTWRHTKAEFTEYMTELTTTGVREYFRPHFFVNTPDINPYFLQRSGRPGFLIRAALATTLSGLWGMYSGFELCEGTPVPGKEEYLDSEKYQIRAWDWQRPGHIIREITELNRIRSENPAFHSHLGIRFLNASNDNILFFIKSTEPVDSGQRYGDNVVLVAINLDPFAAHDTMIELPLWEFGMSDDAGLEVEDLISGARLTWYGKLQSLRLDPFARPYAIWRICRKGA